MKPPIDPKPPSARGPYLQWALAAGLGDTELSRFQPFKGRLVGLMIEWHSEEAARTGAALAREANVRVPRLYLGSQSTGGRLRLHWTLAVPRSALADYVDRIEPLARSIEIGVAVESRADDRVASSIGPSAAPVLAAVLDDGCAFANTRFMSGAQPRVLWLWNQDPEATRGITLDGSNGPTPGADFGFGRQWSRPELQALTTLPGGQDEAYAQAEMPSLRRAAAHGPHVTDLLCGSEDWDLVFVQFPPSGLADPTGRWLETFVRRGLEYVLECAGPNTHTVVANLSWGPQTGPHDGNSPLERWLDECVALFATQNRRLIVTVPAGNSFGSQAHAQIPFASGGSVRWVVPPDGEDSAFLEVWWPKTVDMSNVRLRVRPPSGAAVDIAPGVTPLAPSNWHAVLTLDADSGPKALLTVNPTGLRSPAQRGPHGTWTLEFDAVTTSVVDDIHIWVARADPNMGQRRRAHSSYLTDAALEAHRFVTASQRDEEAPGSAVRRAGTLNGLATGAAPKVAAGYVASDHRMAPYSSSGPSRGPRNGPDYSCVTDQTPLVRGVRASGVRSGTAVRLVGTSTAAPQLGRALVKGAVVAFDPLPHVPPQRKGGGHLPPDGHVVSKR